MHNNAQPKKRSADHARRVNRRLVMNLVRRHAPISRHELSDHTQLTEAAISRITRELINIGLVRETAPSSSPANTSGSTRGRPSVMLDINPNGAYVLGFDIGANGQWITLSNAAGNSVARDAVQFPHEQHPDAFLAHVADQANALIERMTTSIPNLRGKVVGGGVAAAGTVASDCRTIVESGNLGWGKVAAADILSTRLGIPFTVESRPRALALAELERLSDPHARDMLVILIGLGLGSCLVVDGQLLRGHQGIAGHIAHLPIAEQTTACYCGAVGCLDTVASGRAVLAACGLPLAQGSAGAAAGLDAILMQAQSGDQRVRANLTTAGHALGIAIEQLVRFANPQHVVLCGPLAYAPAYERGVLAALANIAVKVRVSTLDVDAVAAWMALDNFVYTANLDIQGLRMAHAS